MKSVFVNLFFTFLFFLVAPVYAKVVLPSVFSDNMVLQQNTSTAVWGTSVAGKTVEVTSSWNNKKYITIVNADGSWKLAISTPAYGGPYTLSISDGDLTVLKNIMIGEVWVCSGQSNMEMPFAGWGKIMDYQKEIDAADYPNIRLLQVVHEMANTTENDVKVSNGGWTPCSPKTVADFSSTAYFFAREIYKKKGIPIGLIHTSWGGTVAEAWMSADALKPFPYFNTALEIVKKNDKQGDEQRVANWQKSVDEQDKGYIKGIAQWSVKGFDDASWPVITVGTAWENTVLPDFDGLVWLRKKIEIPEALANQDLKISLGTIDDNDITYFNGEKIGETTGYDRLRVYTIPARLIKKGVAEITVRVFDGMGGGGIVAKNEELFLAAADGTRISLAGDWKYKIGVDLKVVGPAPASNSSPNRPTVLYNKMIYPFLSFAIRGAIWYQGESNAERAAQYRELFPALINNWRKDWKHPDMPFYFVQLASFKKATTVPGPSAWAELRDAQFNTLKLKNTGMALAIDIGDADDIHPKNKQEVGRRLALIALSKTYGTKEDFSGPLYRNAKIAGNKIKVDFDFSDGLKTTNNQTLEGFTIAGADQKFYKAKAVIVGNQIEVSAENVSQPVAVRYGWADNPSLSLTNKSGLPASPFRTDHWEH